jgi:hypothetical protein
MMASAQTIGREPDRLKALSWKKDVSGDRPYVIASTPVTSGT